jgi:hypothetical protein
MDENARWELEKGIEYVVDAVANRGWADTELEADDFAVLRMDRRIRDAQVAALYEEYFLPERHEFEWQVLSDIVTAVTTSPLGSFVAVAVAGGVIGNAAYDLLKALCATTAGLFESKLGKRASARAKSFRQIGDDCDKLKSFFVKNHKARITEIENSTGIPREKIYPLLKIAGLRHQRRGEVCYWSIPKL